MRRSVSLRAPVLAVLLTQGCACGALLDLEPLQFETGEGGLPPGPRDDAHTDPDANGPPPAEADADAADAHDAGLALVCREAHDFCDDFEGVRTLENEWTGYGQLSAASLTIEDGVLVGTMSRVDGGAGAYAVLYHTGPWPSAEAGVRPRTRARFRARIEQCPPPGPPIELLGAVLGDVRVVLRVGTQAGACVASLEEDALTDAGTTFRFSPNRLIPTGTWLDLELDVSAADSVTPAAATLRIESADPMYFALSTSRAPDTFYFTFGVAQGSLDGTDVHVGLDDLRLDYLK